MQELSDKEMSDLLMRGFSEQAKGRFTYITEHISNSIITVGTEKIAGITDNGVILFFYVDSCVVRHMLCGRKICESKFYSESPTFFLDLINTTMSLLSDGEEKLSKHEYSRIRN